MTLKGTNAGAQSNSMQRTAYRTSWTQPEGGVPAFIHEARIIDINLAKWTVDVLTQFDRHRFLDIQVSSGYQHPNASEGIFVMPEVGAKCLVCIPSDGPPPFVLAFIMPAETQADTSAPETPASTFAGGRARAKPGDIYIKGRDGNFCILHRGGVLQVGSTALAQRIFIPIGNIVTDISANYHHHNSGGSINWMVSAGSPADEQRTAYKHTFRLLADDEKATIRVAVGRFSDVVGLPVGEVGVDDIRVDAGVGKDEPIVCEVTLAPDAIEADSGGVEGGTQGATKLQFAFDKAGGCYLWAAGSVVLATKKKLIVRALDNIQVSTDKSLSVFAKDVARIESKKLLELAAPVVKIGAGSKPVAHVGSLVDITVLAPIPVVVGGVAGTITTGAKFSGIVSTGSPTVLV